MNRRKYPRFQVDLPVSFSEDRLEGTGTMIDLSVEGCRIRSEASVFTGDYLAMQLHLPDQDCPLRIDLAAVRWSIGQEFGVEIIRLSPDQQTRLRELIHAVEERHCSKAYGDRT